MVCPGRYFLRVAFLSVVKRCSTSKDKEAGLNLHKRSRKKMFMILLSSPVMFMNRLECYLEQNSHCALVETMLSISLNACHAAFAG